MMMLNMMIDVLIVIWRNVQVLPTYMYNIVYNVYVRLT